MLVPAFAYAQSLALSSSDINGTANTAATVNATAQTTTGGTSVGVSATVQVKMDRAKTKADTEITRRITALNNILTRVQAMTKVSADFKQNINTAVQAQITALNQLKTKIDADADEATLKVDVQAVTSSYRIYALVMPQVHIAAAADRLATVVNMLSGVGAKLQTRLQDAQTAGKDVTELAKTLTDMASKLADAQTHAQASIDGTASLQPDNGDKTKMQTNLDALKKGRDDLKVAQQDLVAARKDATTILQGLKTLKAAATSTSSSSVQTQ